MSTTLEQQYYNTSARDRTRKNHTGVFSENNPYFIQLKTADQGVGNKADVDALYERSVEWEADQVNYERQKADAAELRAEERAYNSPLQQLQRDRLAGINSDLPGGSASSSSGGTSSQVPLPSMADQQGQTAFGSFEADRQATLQGVSAGASILASIGSFATSVGNFIKTMSLLPSEVSMSNTAAYVADATKDDAVSLSRQSVASGNMQGIRDSLGLVHGLSQLVTPETTDKDATALLSTLGLSADDIPNYLSSIRQAHANPNFKNYFESAEKELRDNEAYNEAFTSELLVHHYQTSAQIQQLQDDYTFHRTKLEASIAALLDTSQNAETIAATESANYQDKYNRVKHELTAYANRLSAQNQAIKDLEIYRQAIFDRAEKEKRTRTPYEVALCNGYNNRIAAFRMLGYAEMSNIYSMMQSAARADLNYAIQFSRGMLKPQIGLKNDIYFNQMTFDDLSTQDVDGFVESLLGSFVDVGTDVLLKRIPGVKSSKP